jgi:hypothetical protein
MSEAIDWAAEAKLLERDDSGSDWDVDFKPVATAALSTLVAKVVAMTPADRARVIIDRGPAGTIAYADIMALAARADFPGV